MRVGRARGGRHGRKDKIRVAIVGEDCVCDLCESSLMKSFAGEVCVNDIYPFRSLGCRRLFHKQTTNV